jgi:hypothetical protein
MSWESIQEELSRGASMGHGLIRRHLRYKTWLESTDPESLIWMRHFNQRVAEFYPDRVRLDCGRYRTFTTKQRLNLALKLAAKDVCAFHLWNIWKERGVWYIASRLPGPAKGHIVLPYRDGMELAYNGRILEFGPAPLHERAYRVKRYWVWAGLSVPLAENGWMAVSLW